MNICSFLILYMDKTKQAKINFWKKIQPTYPCSQQAILEGLMKHI
ncbi:hypothetical protein BTTOUR_02045 [Bacillus thuringiensis serovar toumanoffi]|uniref:Uncharacterized protein n=1 Tax=Bacillus thuringiensis serovar toumanoffi TaxID=180862 RepID=A0ABD5HRS7_BACTU|nr:hypothetical protein [Bacillus thuringiensis serovar toumanoffi]